MLFRARVFTNSQCIRNFINGSDGSSGAALVEFAAITPLLVAAALYTIDLGLMAWNRMEVQHAAQAGAQYAISQVSYDQAAIVAAVNGATNYSVTPQVSQYCGYVASASAIIQCDTTTTLVCDDPACVLLSNAGTDTGSYVKVIASKPKYTVLAPFGITSGKTYDISAEATVRIR
jgi:Flp pilus assembly protein TadG